MALINGMYVFVKDESVNRSVESTTHPVESGIDVSDHVKREPISISLNGEIVGDDAANKLAKIMDMMNKGTLVTYIGRNRFKNGQILSFNTSHPNTIWGGMSFDMEIKELRVVKSSSNGENDGTSVATNERTSVGMQQTTEGDTTKKKHYHTVKKGDSRWSISQQYKANGVTIASLTTDENQKNCLGTPGDWNSLKVGTQIYLGEW